MTEIERREYYIFEQLNDKVEKAFGKNLEYFINNRSRKRGFIEIRHVIAHYCLERYGMNMNEVQRLLKYKNHTSILYLKKHLKDRINNFQFPEYQEYWSKLINI